MTVYVVTAGEYSDYHIAGIFMDKNKAEIFCAIHNDKENSYEEYIIEEYENDDDMEVDETLKVTYKYEFYANKKGSINVYGGSGLHSLKKKNEVIPPHKYFQDYHIIVYLDEPDARDRALKIAQDMWAEYKANVVGGLL
jgi:hypothetical protein